MGSLTILESRPRMGLPDTPPELVSPTATSFSSRSSPSADHIWASHALASLPMSNYDKSSRRDDSYEHQEDTTPLPANTSRQRQQLPSLSSLFGPPSSVRSLNVSLPSRPAAFPLHSSLDRPRNGSVGSHCSSSYFPSPSVQSRVAYDASSTSMVRSVSGSRSPCVAQSQQRYEPETRWMQEDSSRHEYHPGSQDNNTQPPAPGEVAMEHSEDAASEVEEPTSKMGMGPKIWTGTHFLPRFMRAAEVQGEGMCYFYDDGTHCKSVIDGEPVNAHWGVTKAGKPRKRLATACVTCREKKIKCDPDYPRCVQCDKFGRVCKFKNAPRGAQSTSPSTTNAEIYNGDTGSSPQGPEEPQLPAAQSRSTAQHHSGKSLHKRQKLGEKCYSPARAVAAVSEDVMDHSKSPRPEHRSNTEVVPISGEVLKRAWLTDVYMSDPRSIIAVVTQFFVHVDATMLLKFLPEAAWKAHISNSNQRKLPEDLMLLHTVLAFGVVLSGGPRQIASEYAQVAHFAQKNLGFNCLQLVQSRIILAAYCISIGHPQEGSELLASAAAAAASIQLNIELEKSAEANMVQYPFGLSRDGYKESRRRTLWSLFMFERLSGSFCNRPAMINPEDLYIRLPTDNQSFEEQIGRQEPIFNAQMLIASSGNGSRNVLANLVEMTHLWADCQVALYRIASRPASAASESTRLQNLARKLKSWYLALPERLTFSMEKLEDSVYRNNTGSFLSMHILYHHAMIKVNRHHAAATLLGSERQRSYAHTCFSHASSILDLIHAFDNLRRGRTSLNTLPYVMASAAVEAIDALTATGSMSSITEQINTTRDALVAVESLSNLWEDTGSFREAIRRRLDELLYIREQGLRPSSPARGYRVLDTSSGGRWQICEPMDRMLPKNMDVVYSNVL